MPAERGASARPRQPPASSAPDCSLAWEVLASFAGWPRQTGGHGAHWDWVGVFHGAGTEMLVRLEDGKGDVMLPQDITKEHRSIVGDYVVSGREMCFLEGTKVSTSELLNRGAVDVQGG